MSMTPTDDATSQAESHPSDDATAAAAAPSTESAPSTEAPAATDAPAPSEALAPSDDAKTDAASKAANEPAEGAAGDDAGPSFADLELRPELLKTLAGLGYEEPTPIQSETIPSLIAGRDLLGQAATGTGKTAAFALPMLQRLPKGGDRSEPFALVLVPTRELAVQVSEATHRFGSEMGARVLPIYGGQPMSRQLRALHRGVDVVVATPGRALDHIRRGSLRLAGLEMVILDEADEMLDMGFAEDIEEILNETPESRQTILFSATMPPRMDKMARRHLKNPVRIQIERPTVAAGEAPRVRQTAYIVPRAHKPAALGRVLDVEMPTAAIVFCRTRDQVDELTVTLNGRGFRAEALHGGLNQEQRDRVMGRLRNGTTELLIATDVAARGLDIDQLTHVVNYDVPSAAASYVHRIGRVGRAGREGVAITLAEPREHRMLKNIERVTSQTIKVEKVPTVADMRARRLELTRAAVHEHLIADDLDHFRVVVDALSDEFDVMQIALAAVKLAHEAGGDASDEQDIPDVVSRSAGPNGKRGQGGAGHGKRPDRGPAADMTRIFVGAGRSGGVRPQDLVGAIAGESSLSGKEIGAIQITDRFALVEVPNHAADEVVQALRGTRIKGKKATIRLDRDQA